jgi:hypothetical protein
MIISCASSTTSTMVFNRLRFISASISPMKVHSPQIKI